jgi:hypothetical protein
MRDNCEVRVWLQSFENEGEEGFILGYVNMF